MRSAKAVRKCSAVVVCLWAVLATCGVSAQHEHHGAGNEPVQGWSWSYDWNAFVGRNDQIRQFLDYQVWESQNWAMLGADRRSGSHLLSFYGMLSLEPFTIEDRGSPQLFQTGESYLRRPLVNFQHPHDLLWVSVPPTLSAAVAAASPLASTSSALRRSGRSLSCFVRRPVRIRRCP